MNNLEWHSCKIHSYLSILPAVRSDDNLVDNLVDNFVTTLTLGASQSISTGKGRSRPMIRLAYRHGYPRASNVTLFHFDDHTDPIKDRILV
jgi:hypothetical protein